APERPGKGGAARGLRRAGRVVRLELSRAPAAVGPRGVPTERGPDGGAEEAGARGLIHRRPEGGSVGPSPQASEVGHRCPQGRGRQISACFVGGPPRLTHLRRTRLGTDSHCAGPGSSAVSDLPRPWG